MIAEIENLDRAIRAEADELLSQKGLHSLLSNYGEVHVAGSYALRLMAWRDLDIYLVTESISLQDFFQLGGRIAESLDPIKMSFRNELKARTEGLPEGLYWGIYLGDERSGGWKIDLWAMNTVQFAVLDQFRRQIELKLTDSSRRIILEVKSQCWMKPGYRRAYSSLDIYNAVLNEGVTDLAAFESYLQRAKGCTLD